MKKWLPILTPIMNILTLILILAALLQIMITGSLEASLRDTVFLAVASDVVMLLSQHSRFLKEWDGLEDEEDGIDDEQVK